MPPVVYDYLGSIIRWGLTLLLGALVRKGIVDADTTTAMISYLTGAVLVLLWSLWQKYGAKQLQLTAQTMPPQSTETAVKAKIATGVGVPSVMTAANAVPLPQLK